MLRHSAFWLMYYLHTLITSLNNFDLKTLTDPLVYKYVFIDTLQFLPIYLFSVYFSIYFILPRYLTKRNVSFLFLSIAFLIVITLSSGYFTSLLIIKNEVAQWDYFDVITKTMRKCSGNQIVVTGSAAIIKVMKEYAVKQQENHLLEIEHVRHKLHLLKLQIHPRILFQCLHNIYEDIDAGTKHAPEMILKLSDLLNYLLYESEKKEVALAKEITMIENYVELKKTDGLNVQMEINGDINKLFISPGLFLPLLELGIVPAEANNNNTSITISLKTLDSKVYFSVINITPGIRIMEMPMANSILENIKNRLNLSHFRKFKLEYNSTPGNFNVMLQIELQKNSFSGNKESQNNKSVLYAQQ